MTRHREDVAIVMAELIGDRADVESRVTFGVPGYLTRGKMFACVNHAGIALKLPAATISGLTGEEFGPFGRPGHPMRGWVQITRADPADFQQDAPLIEQSLTYVAELAEDAPPKPRKTPKPRTRG